MDTLQDVLAWIEAHADHWRPGTKYPGITYWTLARTRARDDLEFLRVIDFTKEHGRAGRFLDRKNAINYLQIEIDGEQRLLWAMPMPGYMQRGLFMARDQGQIRWADQHVRVRTRTARQVVNTKPFAPLAF